ncbi:DUF3093 family protein [Stackebrandtia endophytica]|uniref:DUF3093 family protein n=1 Tax=Stackebrandtia endophytica TaxID=1496996 RepID=A0A543B300_9ACTN|nr:DUF3093 domain-containing protein [Stackebrandtia endophytica]TQL79209.1 DUF3093 family protein [Stackebrandtia endophytica]
MASDKTTGFQERLTVPWWAWPLSLALACFLAFEIGLGVPGLVTWLPFAVLIPLTVFGLAWIGRIKVRVSAGSFHVDDAVLPLEVIESVQPLTGTALRDALSAQLHPIAFVIQRPWIKSAVKVTLADPGDPTPYWIISSRRAHTLAEVLSPIGAAPQKSAPQP